ncbi:MAG: flagellar basal body-associated FliL family protein [Azoarcus sp.]|jgi:flagellar FliL protein|nr:flagellar basal body-associated FliL family protein [Azoarcus sp.]
MAQAAKAPAKPETPAAPPRRSGKLLLIILLIALLILILAVMGVVALLLLKKGGSAGGHDVASENAAPVPVITVVDLNKPPVFAMLDPFTVNLSGKDGDEGRYLQAVIALRVADQGTADALKGWMPEIRHSIIMLLSSKLPSEVQDAQGRETLAGEIQAQINTRLGAPPPSGAPGPVQAVLFNSFIIQ